MSFHDTSFPAPAPQSRVDGWTAARQRLFLETLAATGIIRLACDAVHISHRSAYNLRIRRDGAAFRLGWDAAILIARARLADDLLARAITGQTETIHRDEDNFQVTRHRHDNRLAMSMLARLDRMADCPAEGTDAALARIVAQDFTAYLDMLCPPGDADAPVSGADMGDTGADARLPPAPAPAPAPAIGDAAPEEVEDIPPEMLDQVATALSPGASAALFIAARRTLHGASSMAASPLYQALQRHCELPAPLVDLMTLPPDEAAARLRALWWDEDREEWRTDYPAPPGFDGEESDSVYEIDAYERALSPQEEEAFAARQAEEQRPYEEAAARARDAFFGFAAVDGAPG